MPGNVVCKLNYMAVSLSLYRSMTKRVGDFLCFQSVICIAYGFSVNGLILVSVFFIYL